MMILEGHLTMHQTLGSTQVPRFCKRVLGFFKKTFKGGSILGLSHVFFRELSGAVGGDTLRSLFHILSGASISGCVRDCN